MGAVMGTVRGFALMGPQCRDARGAERAVDGRGNPFGPWRDLLTAGRHLVDVDESFGASSSGQTQECLRGVERPPGCGGRIAGHRTNGRPPVAPRG